MKTANRTIRASQRHRRSIREAREAYGEDFASEADDADYFEREQPDSNETLGLKQGGPY